jgi:YidC/Oxa1 family membrane protein insertase
MKRNTIIAIVIIAAIIFLWGYLNRPARDEMARQTRMLDSLRRAQLEQRDKTVVDEQHKDTLSVTSKKDTAYLGLGQEKGISGLFSKQKHGKNEFYTLENNLIKLKISTKGGKPYCVELKEHKPSDSIPFVLFSGDSTVFGLNIFTKDWQLISTNDYYFTPLSDKKDITVKDEPATLIFRLCAKADKYIEFAYMLEPSSYMVDFSVNIVGSRDIIKNEYPVIGLNWSMLISRQGNRKRQNENAYTTIYYKYDNDEIVSLPPRSNYNEQDNKRLNWHREINKESLAVKWIAFKGRYYSSVLIAENNFAKANLKSVNLPGSSKYVKYLCANTDVPIYGNDNENISLRFYFGPNKSKYLKIHYNDIKLYKVIKPMHLIAYSFVFVLTLCFNCLYPAFWFNILLVIVKILNMLLAL